MASEVLELQRAAGNRAVSTYLAQTQTVFVEGIEQRHEGGAATRTVAGLSLQRQPAASVLTATRLNGNDRLQKAVRNNPPLCLNEKGDGVRVFQEALQDIGFPLPRSSRSGTMDGIYGPETRGAVRRFQVEFGVPQPSGLQAGRRTLTALDRQLGGTGGPGPGETSCSTTGTFNLPSGDLTPAWDGTTFGVPWNMSATFSPDPEARCGPCGEYRQRVRGFFDVNGTRLTHRLGSGQILDPTTFQEDGIDSGGRTLMYGYHSLPFATSNFTQPDQHSGHQWDGFDQPGVSANTGDNLTINLEFTGELVDVCNQASLGGSAWTVKGTVVQP